MQAGITVTIDTAHPTVVAGAATEQAPLSSRTLTFSKAIDPATLTASTVTLVGPGGTTIPVSGLTGSGTTYLLSFSTPLTTAGSYTVNVGAGVADLAGNLLATPTSDAFTLNTVSAPVSVALDPASDTGASHTDGLTNITTPTFDVTVNKSGSIELDVDGAAVATQAVAGAGLVPITLTTGLADGQHAIKAIFTPSAGTAVQAGITVTIDTQHPTVVAGAATEQPPLASRTLTFSKAIDPATFTASTVTLVGPGGTTIPVSALTGSGTTYLLSFSTPLIAGGTYTVNVGAGVADLAGNSLAAPTSDSFTLLPDLTTPSVVAFAPLGFLNTDVSTLSVQFSKAIDPTSFTASTVTVVTPSGTIPGRRSR